MRAPPDPILILLDTSLAKGASGSKTILPPSATVTLLREGVSMSRRTGVEITVLASAAGRVWSQWYSELRGKYNWHHCFSIDNEIRSRFKIYSQLYVQNLWLLAKILCNSHRHCEYREVLFNRLKSKFNQSLHVQYVVYFVCYCHPLKCLLPHFYMIIRNSKYTQENQSIFSNTHLVFPCVWIAPPTESFLVVGTGGSNAEDDWERDQQEL